MHKYEVIIYWSQEDGAFIAEVPELPGCAAHGETPEGALASCQEGIALWLDTAKQAGRPIPEPKGRRLPCGSSFDAAPLDNEPVTDDDLAAIREGFEEKPGAKLSPMKR